MSAQVIEAMAKAMYAEVRGRIGRDAGHEPTPWDEVSSAVRDNWLRAAAAAWAAVGDEADLFWNAEDPEYSVESPEQEASDAGLYAICQMDGGIRTWTRFYVELPTSFDEAGDPDERNVEWFATFVEAERAVAKAKEAARAAEPPAETPS